MPSDSKHIPRLLAVVVRDDDLRPGYGREPLAIFPSGVPANNQRRFRELKLPLGDGELGHTARSGRGAKSAGGDDVNGSHCFCRFATMASLAMIAPIAKNTMRISMMPRRIMLQSPWRIVAATGRDRKKSTL